MSGSGSAALTAFTPELRAPGRSRRAEKPIAAPCSGISCKSRGNRAVTTLAGWNPSGECIRFRNDRSIRPPHASGTIESATSATTRARCNLRAPDPVVSVRPARSGWPVLPDASRQAGSKPKSMLVTADSASANRATGASISILDCKGM